MNLIVDTEANQLVFEHLYSVQGYATIRISVVSEKFRGTSNFCISHDNIRILVQGLSEIHRSLAGDCEIKDYDSDAFLKFEMKQLGHVNIAGQIGGSHEDHMLRFGFITDQTIVTKLIRVLGDILTVGD